MKKVISMILAVMLIVMPSGTVLAEDAGILDAVLNRLAEYTPEEREGFIGYFRPFVTTDTGVSAALINLDSGLMDSMIQNIAGGSLDKPTIRRMFLSFTCIKDETELRLEYADIFQKKIELEGASSSTLSGVQKLMNALFARSSAAEKIFTEDAITAGVVANMLTIIPKINGNKVMIKYEDGIFEINAIDQTFSDDFDAVWDGFSGESGQTVTYYKLVDKLVGFLNDDISQSDKSSVAKALANLDVCEVPSSGSTGGSGTGGGSTGGGNTGTGTDGTSDTDKPDNTKPSGEETGDYTVLESYDGVTAELLGGGFIIKTKADAANVIEISTQAGSPMLYEFDGGSLVPVKYSVPSEKGILARVKADCVYVVKSLSYPFEDANGWGKSYIAALYNRGIINGKSEASFEPDASITREEFVKLVVELFELNDTTLKVDFNDVAEGAWYYSYVASAFENKIVSGIGENMFGTGQKIKRQDMAKIINTVLEASGIRADKADSSVFADYDKINDYAKDHVLAIYGLGIISGDDNGNFNPNQFATRQEAAKMVYGMLTAYVNSLKE